MPNGALGRPSGSYNWTPRLDVQRVRAGWTREVEGSTSSSGSHRCVQMCCRRKVTSDPTYHPLHGDGGAWRCPRHMRCHGGRIGPTLGVQLQLRTVNFITSLHNLQNGVTAAVAVEHKVTTTLLCVPNSSVVRWSRVVCCGGSCDTETWSVLYAP